MRGLRNSTVLFDGMHGVLHSKKSKRLTIFEEVLRMQARLSAEELRKMRNSLSALWRGENWAEQWGRNGQKIRLCLEPKFGPAAADRKWGDVREIAYEVWRRELPVDEAIEEILHILS